MLLPILGPRGPAFLMSFEVVAKSADKAPRRACRISRYVAVCLPLLSEQFVLAMPSSMLTAIRLEWALDDSTITYVLAAGTALNGVGKFAGGVLIDRYGARRFLSVSMFLMVIGAGIFGTGLTMALVGYVILQLCAAGGWLSACKLMEQHFEPELWSWCFAVVGVGSRAGSALSKLALGSLLKVMHWQSIAWSTGVAMVLLRYICLWFIPLERMTPQRPSQGYTTRPWCERVLHITCNPSMLLYFCIVIGCYSIAHGAENDAPLILQDALRLSPADASISASVYPAGLFTSLLLAAPLYSFLRRRCAKFALELTLQILAVVSAFTLTKAVSSGWSELIAFEVLFFLLALSVGLTYYVTPNMFPLFYGDDCAFASAMLDVVGLSSSFMFQMASSVIFRSGGSWEHVLMLLTGLATFQLLATSVLSLFPRLTPHLAFCEAVPDEVTNASSDPDLHNIVETAQIIGHKHEDGEDRLGV